MNEINTSKNLEYPTKSPLAKRVCECGCENEFQPRRKDQIYLNSQHANFAYNHGKRKKKNKDLRTQESILRKNDQILNNFWTNFHNDDNYVVLRLKSLLNKKFDQAYFVGMDPNGKNPIYFSYRYMYTVITQNEIEYIKIEKR